MPKRDVVPGGYPDAMPFAVREFPPVMQLMWLDEQGVGFFEADELTKWKATIRRRANRPHRGEGSSWMRQKLEREQQQHEACDRAETMNQHAFVREMCIRVYRSIYDAPDIARQYIYWTARYCGWDVLAIGEEGDMIRRTTAGVKCGPEECAAWLFWAGLFPIERREMVEEAAQIYRPYRCGVFGDGDDGETPNQYHAMATGLLSNPAFEVTMKRAA